MLSCVANATTTCCLGVWAGANCYVARIRVAMWRCRRGYAHRRAHPAAAECTSCVCLAVHARGHGPAPLQLKTVAGRRLQGAQVYMRADCMSGTKGGTPAWHSAVIATGFRHQRGRVPAASVWARPRSACIGGRVTEAPNSRALAAPLLQQCIGCVAYDSLRRHWTGRGTWDQMVGWARLLECCGRNVDARLPR